MFWWSRFSKGAEVFLIILLKQGHHLLFQKLIYYIESDHNQSDRNPVYQLILQSLEVKTNALTTIIYFKLLYIKKHKLVSFFFLNNIIITYILSNKMSRTRLKSFLLIIAHLDLDRIKLFTFGTWNLLNFNNHKLYKYHCCFRYLYYSLIQTTRKPKTFMMVI